MARATGPAKVQCVRCGKQVRPTSRELPRAHNCAHGWACVPPGGQRPPGHKPCPLCFEARQLNLWQRLDGKGHA